MITVVGIGYQENDLTMSGMKVISGAKKVFLRTAESKAGKSLSKLVEGVISFDYLYQSANDFDQLKQEIIKTLLEAGDCVFCVDGGGGDDPIVKELKKSTSIKIISGVTVEAFALSIYPDTSVQSKSASDIISNDFLIASDSTLVIKEIADKFLASELKLKLLDAYGEVDCIFVKNGKEQTISIVDLDRMKSYDYSTFIILPYQSFTEKKRFTIEDLYGIVYRLVAPDGCPWDKVQTHQSIRECCLEEAYELVEAIELDDIDKMVEEAGDVLLQGVFHSNIAERAGEFTLNDVITGVCKKLLGRHLHIFSTEKALSPDEAHAVWEKAKAIEKSQNTYKDRMEQVATTLPALIRAGKIQKISEKMGFTQDSLEYWLDNINEELDEFVETRTEEEAGDVLYAVVRLIRSFGINPELALMTTIRKMIARFEKMEELALSRNLDFKTMKREDILALYDEVKNG